MADPQRMRVDEHFLHHAVTPEWKNKSKPEIAQWFSDNGFARAYGSNPANWSGLINPFTGTRSYAQAQSVGQMVDGSTPDATAAERAKGYRVFWIVADPIGQICWHAGDWTHNRRSTATENLGDYRNYALTQGAKEALADFIRPLDQAVGGILNVLLHNEVYATACPARIAEGRNDIVALINSGGKKTATADEVRQAYRDILEREADAGGIATYTSNGMSIDEVRADLMKSGERKALEERKRSYALQSTVDVTGKNFRVKSDTQLVKFPENTRADVTGTIDYKAGADIKFAQKLTYKNGAGDVREFYRTAFWAGKGQQYGFAAGAIEEVVPKVETKDETKTEAVPFTTKTTEDATLAKGTRVISVAGKNGVRTIVYSVTYTDGKETARSVKSDSVTTAPVAEEVVVGTRVDTPKDVEQDARLSALEAFAQAVKDLFAKIAEAFSNWRKK